MDASAVTAASASASRATLSGKTLTSNFDTFLKLLTAQLKFQDPLEPMDSSEFTRQLVQYSGVEQQIQTNTNLEALIGMGRSQGHGAAVSYIGRDVAAPGSDAMLSGGAARWTYVLPREAASVNLTVVDEGGRPVFASAGPGASGRNTIEWDGRTTAGGTAPDGVYSLRVNARDAAGNPVAANGLIEGRVDSIEIADGEAFLVLGGLRLRMSEVTRVSAAPGGI